MTGEERNSFLLLAVFVIYNHIVVKTKSHIFQETILVECKECQKKVFWNKRFGEKTGTLPWYVRERVKKTHNRPVVLLGIERRIIKPEKRERKTEKEINEAGEMK